MCYTSAKFSLLLPVEVIIICEEFSSFGLFQVAELCGLWQLQRLYIIVFKKSKVRIKFKKLN